MSSGKEAKAAFAKASTWGTAVSVANEDAFLFTSEKLTKSVEALPDDSAGQAFYTQSDQGLITCSGDLTAYLRYEGLDVLLAMAMGSAGAPTQVEDTSSTYKSQLSLAGDLDGFFGTLALYKGISVHEYAGVKVDGFTLEGSAGQPLTVAFNLICDDLTVNTTEGANTAAAMGALTPPGPGNRVLFRQADFLMNDASGAALARNDVIRPNRFSISFKRGLVGDHLAGGNDRIAEPTNAAFPEVSLSLEFPTYTSDTYITDLGSDIRKKMSITFTGGEIEAENHYSLELLFPHVVITNADAAVDKAGKIAHPITATLLGVQSPPAAMTGVTGPFALNLTNTKQTDPLA